MAAASSSQRKSAVVLATQDESVDVCLDRMAEANVGSILVVDGGRPVGILTERDLLRHWRQFLSPEGSRQPIGKIATKPVFCLNLKAIANAPKEMLARRIRHIPLISDEGLVVGMMSMRDILAAQAAAGALPKLSPRGPKSQGLSACTLHVLTPTAELASVCRRFVPSNWRCREWSDPQAFVKLTEADSDVLSHMAMILDLDGLAQDGWRLVVKRCLKLLTQAKRPAIFVVSSPTRFSEQELQSLQEVAKKAHWRTYSRPLPVGALAHDLAELNAVLAVAKEPP